MNKNQLHSTGGGLNTQSHLNDVEERLLKVLGRACTEGIVEGGHDLFDGAPSFQTPHRRLETTSSQSVRRLSDPPASTSSFQEDPAVRKARKRPHADTIRDEYSKNSATFLDKMNEFNSNVKKKWLMH